VRERSVAGVSAVLFIDHLVDEAETIPALRCNLIISLGSPVLKTIHHPGAHR
jgi:hypothetical protein